MALEQLGPQQGQLTGLERLVQGIEPQTLQAVAQADKTGQMNMSEQLIAQARQSVKAGDPKLLLLGRYLDNVRSPTGNILSDGGLIFWLMGRGEELGMDVSTSAGRQAVARHEVESRLQARQAGMQQLNQTNNAAFPTTPGAQ